VNIWCSGTLDGFLRTRYVDNLLVTCALDSPFLLLLKVREENTGIGRGETNYSASLLDMKQALAKVPRREKRVLSYAEGLLAKSLEQIQVVEKDMNLK
jgi:hypothetical protein